MTSGNTKRARLTETGWQRNLAVELDGPRPEVRCGQVLVQVEACGVCHRDLIDRSGRFRFMKVPITPGHEVVGRVVEVFDDASEWQGGDRVATLHREFCGECRACRAGETSLCERAITTFGLTVDGGYASLLLAPERSLYRMNEALPAAEAAVLHCTFGTAYRGLRRAAVGRESRVVVTGANGGVGVAAVQVAKRFGAFVIAVVREPAHRDFLHELGADQVVIDGGAGFHKSLSEPATAALDCVGSPTFNAALRSLCSGGTIVTVGNVTDARVELNLGYLITRGISVHGSSGASREDMRATLELHARKPFQIPIHARLPLEQADHAQRRLLEGGVRGRLVLELTENDGGA